MRIILFGDSVFAGYGLSPDATLPKQLAKLVAETEVVAAGVVDQTSADGLARVETVRGDLVLVEFGLNDAITGVKRERVLANLRAIVDRLGSRAMLVEALVPAGARWPAITDLAGVAEEASGGVDWVPDILAGPAEKGLLQADGLHPNAAGASLIARRLAAAVQARLR